MKNSIIINSKFQIFTVIVASVWFMRSKSQDELDKKTNNHLPLPMDYASNEGIVHVFNSFHIQCRNHTMFELESASSKFCFQPIHNNSVLDTIGFLDFFNRLTLGSYEQYPIFYITNTSPASVDFTLKEIAYRKRKITFSVTKCIWDLYYQSIVVFFSVIPVVSMTYE